MSRQLIGAALLSAAMASCSSTPSDPSPDHGRGVEQLGSISLPLTAEVGGVVFRLNKAQFTISGAALGKVPRIVKPLPDVPVHTETLPAGAYSILLENGWVLERKGVEAGATFVAIQAKLITPNPVAFDVTSQATTDTWFNFVTSAGDVSLGRGNVDIHIGVQDCASFDSVTAALATYTVDCTGIIGPDSFNVSRDGILTRAFDSCPLDDANKLNKLESIDSLLSLQFRSARLPFAKECLGGRFASFKAKFADSGILECPAWKKDRTVNPITDDVIGKVVQQLPKLPADDNGEPLPFMADLKENNLYSVFFPSQVPPAGQKCETPADCATACAAGFPGFVITGKETTVLTDPVAWLIDTVFPSGKNPFMRPGYYHPMSYYPSPPGVQFGHRNRVPEFCSFFAGIHLQYPLELDCLNPAIPSTCVSICAPP